MSAFKNEERVFQQDLNSDAEKPGMIFFIRLLMEEKCEMPDKQLMSEIMNKHLGDTDCFSYSDETAGFAAKKYKIHFSKDNAEAYPMLMITGCSKIKKPILDDFEISQLWDCPNGAEILDNCTYSVNATDMLAAGLDASDRAEMLVDYIEALVEMFPSCKAVIFETSKKMFTRENIVNCTVPKKHRFIYYAVNVRFFNIQGGRDKLVDTLGMSTLFMPDLQYHFHDMEPDAIVNHAFNMLTYIFEKNNPIKPNDNIDGVKDGKMSMEVQWKVRYENSLIQPSREVIDVNMGEYAAGNR